MSGEYLRYPFSALRPGSIVRLPDGREGTVVSSNLAAFGIKWGRHDVTIDDLTRYGDEDAVGYEWAPDALLRDDYADAGGLECVGLDIEIMEPDA